MGKKNMTNVLKALEESFKRKEDSSFVFFIDKNFPAFEGHFPGAPLLPAIVQIEISLFCVRLMFGEKKLLSGIKKAKFIKPVPPDSEIRVAVNENGGICNVTIKNGEELCSQISLQIA